MYPIPICSVLMVCSSGCEVITTASPHNFYLCKSMGAHKVFDYRDPEVGDKIREVTNDKLKLVLDCISEKTSPAICAAAISSEGGHYSALLPVSNFPRDDVKCTRTLAYTALGDDFSEELPANQADFEFGVKFWNLSEQLLNSGAIRPHNVEQRHGGLEAIPKGLRDLEEGKVSGVKLVYRVS